MKLPNWLKITWWLALTVGLTILLSIRFTAYKNGEATVLDMVAFVTWVALLLAPLFNEVSMFGVSLKTELKELKADVKKEIHEFRNEVANAVAINNQVSPSFYFPTPPSDSDIPQLEDRIRRTLHEELDLLGVQPSQRRMEVVDVGPEVTYMFKTRYNVEKELRRIWNDRADYRNELSSRRLPSIRQMARDLVKLQLIDPEIASIITEVYSITSPAIHAEEPSPIQYKFVQDVAPELLATLRAIS